MTTRNRYHDGIGPADDENIYYHIGISIIKSHRQYKPIGLPPPARGSGKVLRGRLQRRCASAGDFFRGRGWGRRGRSDWWNSLIRPPAEVTRPSPSAVGRRLPYRRTTTTRPPADTSQMTDTVSSPHRRRRRPSTDPPDGQRRVISTYIKTTLCRPHAYLVGALAVDGHDKSHAARLLLQLRVVQTVFFRTGPRVVLRHRLLLVRGHVCVRGGDYMDTWNSEGGSRLDGCGTKAVRA